MGDTRLNDGVLEHETSKGRWERIVLDQCGKPLSVCLHGEEPNVALDEGGNFIMELGGVAVSMTPEMAAQWADVLSKLVPEATETALRAAHTAKVETYRQSAAEERTRIEEETRARREELTQLAASVNEQRLEMTELAGRIDNLRAEHQRLDAEAEAKRGAATSSG